MATLEPLQTRYRQLVQSDGLDAILAAGALKARRIAEITLMRVKKAVGLR